MVIPCQQPSNYLHCINFEGYFKRRSLWRLMRRCHLSRKVKGLKPGTSWVQALCKYARPVSDSVNAVLELRTNCAWWDNYWHHSGGTALHDGTKSWQNRRPTEVLGKTKTCVPKLAQARTGVLEHPCILCALWESVLQSKQNHFLKEESPTVLKKVRHFLIFEQKLNKMYLFRSPLGEFPQ